jgi:hypothetical protein
MPQVSVTRRARSIFGVAVLTLATGCRGEKSAPAAGVSASAQATTAAAPHGTTAAAEATVTRGEVELHEGKKGKVAFTIELPKGLKDVSERPYMKEYAKQAKVYDGYSIMIMEANPALARLDLEPALALVSKDPDFVKNRAKLVDKGTTGDGWYFAHTIQEGKKKSVVLTAVARKGDVALQCRGSVEGPLANRTEASAAVLVKACKTLKLEL